nr:MAG TPA: hypothetical protein [Caudoviricetes sp.]
MSKGDRKSPIDKKIGLRPTQSRKAKERQHYDQQRILYRNRKRRNER